MRKRKYIHTLVALVILAAGWGAITYYDRYKSHESTKTESSQEQKLLSLDSKQIRSVTFKPQEGEAVTCRREGGTWTIVEPEELPADQSAFTSFLSSLTSATVDEVVGQNPTSLKEFGLDPPSYTLQLSTDSKPSEVSILLGDETPTGSGVYAQVSSAPRVVTLASYLKSSLEKKLFDLRDRRALTLDADQIRKIQADYKGKTWRLEKNPEGVWDLVLPPPVRADRFTAEGLISQLRGLTMQSIIAENKKGSGNYGFGSPDLRLQLTSPSGTQTIVVGKKQKEGDRYLAENSALKPVFTLSPDFVHQFEKDASDLREKDLFSFSGFEAKHVEVRTPQGQGVFERQKDQWNQTAPTAKKIAGDKMDSFLSSLRDLRADSFPKGGNPTQFGLEKPAYQFTVVFGDKNTTETVDAAKINGHVYARRSTDTLPSELPTTSLDDVEKALKNLE